MNKKEQKLRLEQLKIQKKLAKAKYKKAKKELKKIKKQINNMYTLKGELKTIHDTRQVSEKFKLREFVVTDNSGQYPQTIQFQACQDSCDLLNHHNVGDMVEVFFNLRGREWTNPQGEVKVFNTLDAWKIMSMGQSAATNPAETFVAEPTDDSDLPF